MLRLVAGIVRTEGPAALYAGLSASLLRQATYSTVRFGTYEFLKQRRLDQLAAADAASAMVRTTGASSTAGPISSSRPGRRPTELPLLESVGFSLLGGALGGVAGNPADLCNVRMQNDRRLPAPQRRNYRNVFHALACVARNEGVAALWNGVGPNVARGMLMTAGQLASYDVAKGILVGRFGCSDKNVSTHLTASCLAGVVATVLTQPVDVLKTRCMNSAKKAAAAANAGAGAGTAAASSASPAIAGAPMPGMSATALARHMLATEGAMSFYKGFVPALTRLGPHTIATFLILEQLKRLVA
jgi:hypothetical protein